MDIAGYHCPVSEDLKSRTTRILSIVFENTSLIKFQECIWNAIQRFKFPMPDQPEPVSGSCGVAVICAARDTCKGHEDSFTWTYQDAPQLRAQLMTDIISLA